jgi:hypothetical protein
MKYFYIENGQRTEYVPAENETIQASGDHYLVLVDTGIETYHKDLKLEGEEEKEEKEEPKKEEKKEEKPKKK